MIDRTDHRYELAPDRALVERLEQTVASSTSAPTSRALSYSIAPAAIVCVFVLRHFGLVARSSVWACSGALIGAQMSIVLVERWREARLGSWQLHARVALHAAAVTAALYVTGWGPVLGMGFAFSAFVDIQLSGSRAWRPALGWSLLGCAVGQTLVLFGWAPSF